LGDAPGRPNAGIKAMTLIHSALAGGDCIEDADVLRAGPTEVVLGHALRAPSTLGTFLRSFSWGDVRSLDRVARVALGRAWAAGAGPRGDVTIDLDSSICETYGLAKEGGSRFCYNHVRGYHPMLAVAEDQVLHARLRGGPAHSGRGAKSFLAETFARVREAGYTGSIVLRADSGFYNHHVTAACDRARVRWSITARMSAALHRVIAAIPEEEWVPIPYFMEGAAVAETTYVPFAANHKRAKVVRLIVRRVPPSPGSQLALYVEFSYHAFVTNRDGEMLALEADHRAHAEVENTIRDLKYGMGLNHLPSGRFGANGAWFVFNVMAHNLVRWAGAIAFGEGAAMTAKTFRTRLVALPGRLTRSGRRMTLHLPQRWPWEEQFMSALVLLRTVCLTA